MQGVEANKNQSDKRGKLLQKPTLLSKHQQSAPPVSNKGDSITSISSSSSKPFQLAGIKSMRTSKGTPSVTLKPKLSIGSQLPLKRLSPDSVRHDDDFEWKILAAQMICFYSLGSASDILENRIGHFFFSFVLENTNTCRWKLLLRTWGLYSVSSTIGRESISNLVLWSKPYVYYAKRL